MELPRVSTNQTMEAVQSYYLHLMNSDSNLVAAVTVAEHLMFDACSSCELELIVMELTPWHYDARHGCDQRVAGH